SGDFSSKPTLEEFPVSEAGALDQLFTPAFIIFVVFLFLSLVILAVVVANLARAALIGMVDEVETAGSTTVKSGFRQGFAAWFRVFLQSLLIWVPYVAIVLVVGGTLAIPPVLSFVAESQVLGVVLAVISGLVFVVLLVVTAIPLALISQLAVRLLVLERLGVVESVGSAYRMFRANVGQVLLVWLILVVVGTVVGFALLMVALVVAVPAFILAMISPWLLLVFAVPGLLILAFLGGLVQVFASTTWTLAFRELQGGQGSPATEPQAQGA
ncbi:MAG: hypothetical protein ACE5E0_05055, partial [Terriglobia bacterium]